MGVPAFLACEWELIQAECISWSQLYTRFWQRSSAILSPRSKLNSPAVWNCVFMWAPFKLLWRSSQKISHACRNLWLTHARKQVEQSWAKKAESGSEQLHPQPRLCRWANGSNYGQCSSNNPQRETSAGRQWWSVVTCGGVFVCAEQNKGNCGASKRSRSRSAC